MDLNRALRVTPACCFAWVGAGGKTTGIFTLVSQMVRAGHPVVFVTTTTHLGSWQISSENHHLILTTKGDLDKIIDYTGVIVLTGVEQPDHRLAGLERALLEPLLEYAQDHQIPVMIEADGARQKALKAPATHEPLIPPGVDTVVVTAGLSALHQSLSDQWVHRPERFATLSSIKVGEEITLESLMRVLRHPEGGMKNIPSAARRVVLFNQADTPNVRQEVGGLTSLLLQDFHTVVVATLGTTPQPEIFTAHERLAGIVLAAGGGARYNQAGTDLPKQLLLWRGMPFVRCASLAALQAGLSPVVVVTGAYGQEVAEAVQDLPVKLVHNTAWQEGQSTSLQIGLEVLPPYLGGAVFLLADQPTITGDLLKLLAEAHSRELPAILAPSVYGKRANPVLFDQDTFADLRLIRGDMGGRSLFTKYPVQLLPWEDPNLLLDVDTPQDYQRLLELQGET